MNRTISPLSRRGWLTVMVSLLLPLAGWGQVNPVAGPERFEREIVAFEASDRTAPPPRNAMLFLGASNIRRWTTLAQDIRNPPVINRGFGGAYLRDVLHYADRILFPYQPRAIVLQAGGNDIHGGRTTDEVLDDLSTLVGRIHERLPQTTITILSIPPSEARWSEVERIRATNERLRAFAANDPEVSFIDLFASMLNDRGRPREELFAEDRLHLNARGYELWTSLIRWDREIKDLEASDKQAAHPPGGIVFVGSSSIKRWVTLASDFPGFPVINHGFGGSQIFDSVVFADVLVTRLKPRMVVFYAGANDINAGKKAGRVLADFQAFVQQVHASSPATRIAFISIAGNPARWAQVEEIKAANRLVEEYTNSDSRLEFIDVFQHMLGDDGLPKPDIFVADRLHMNDRGYEIWKEQVGPRLR